MRIDNPLIYTPVRQPTRTVPSVDALREINPARQSDEQAASTRQRQLEQNAGDEARGTATYQSRADSSALALKEVREDYTFTLDNRTAQALSSYRSTAKLSSGESGGSSGELVGLDVYA